MIIEIDSSTRYQKKVTLKEGDKIIKQIETDGDILVALKLLLTESNLKLNDVDKITTIPSGPSFTGLRIGAAISNALNYTTGKLIDFKDLNDPAYPSPPNITPKKVDGNIIKV
ncbi:MAG: hypothetical protein NT141_01520 [candidate division WWE3 bacterium]|nr:hypothetical protein [candidate division WWE3 bacterium]